MHPQTPNSPPLMLFHVVITLQNYRDYLHTYRYLCRVKDTRTFLGVCHRIKNEYFELQRPMFLVWGEAKIKLIRAHRGILHLLPSWKAGSRFAWSLATALASFQTFSPTFECLHQATQLCRYSFTYLIPNYAKTVKKNTEIRWETQLHIPTSFSPASTKSRCRFTA